MYRHLWVTPFAADERYPAGDYPFQHAGGAGLPAWTAADRATADTDVVLWYVFGTNHIPRPEDWPVMPVERTGFHLKPVGFFDRARRSTCRPRSTTAEVPRIIDDAGGELIGYVDRWSAQAGQQVRADGVDDGADVRRAAGAPAARRPEPGRARVPRDAGAERSRRHAIRAACRRSAAAPTR